MPLKSARRLPRRFNRPTSAATRSLVERRQTHRKQLKRERTKRWLRRVQRSYNLWQQFFLRWVLVGILGFLILLLGIVLFSPLAHVRSMTIIRSDPRLDIEQAQTALAPLFGQHILLVSEMEARTLLRESIADLADVELQKNYPSELAVTITLDPLLAKVKVIDPEQPTDVATQTGSFQEYLSEKGVYVITSSPQSVDTLPYYQLVDWSVRPQAGDALVTVELLERLSETEAALLDQFGQKVILRSIYIRGQEFHLQIEGGVSLWFDMRSSLEKHLQRYRGFLKSVGLNQATMYVDLRIADRVVYK